MGVNPNARPVQGTLERWLCQKGAYRARSGGQDGDTVRRRGCCVLARGRAVSLPEPKDHIVSNEAVRMIAEAIGRRCLVVSIYVVSASKRDIEKLVDNSVKCINVLLEKIVNYR